MNAITSFLMFIIGTIFGSFYNVVGYRTPNNESIVYPPSHCPKCQHKLKYYELIPIISYIALGGKCKKCHEKISPFYPIFELLTGILFFLSYLSFGLSNELIIALTFISMLIIITVSDYNYMIIPDNVLITFGVLLITEIFIIYGYDKAISALLNGTLSFLCMYLIKIFGDYIFKKESMGGGDIKLLFIIGMVLTFPVALFSIFVGSVIGLPLAAIQVLKKHSHILPFGPLLAMGAIILLLLKIDINTIISFYK